MKMYGYINGKKLEILDNETILDCAQRNKIFIPSLCEMKDLNHSPASCRVCLVEMEYQGSQQMVCSCATPMEEGMKIQTRTKAVREAQRLQVQLLLADHDQNCAVCIRHGDCELQDTAQFVGLKDTSYEVGKMYNQRSTDNSSPSITRDMSRCIRCFRCVNVCRQVQSVDALMISGNGLLNEISLKHAKDLQSSNCVACGQCTLVCPVGALHEKDDTEKVIDFLYDPDVFTTFQFAPAVRVALGEEFGMPAGSNVEGQMVTALKNLGADLVLDTNLTADLVVMEEGTELLARMKNNGTLPLITSCSPGWVNFMEKHYPELIPHLSTVKSPQQCFGALAKTYIADQMKIDPRKMKVISVMPCTAKKGEALRPEFAPNGNPDVDVVLTTREFARLLKSEGIWLPDLESGEFDSFGGYSGAAEIFASTGGVMEAAIRTVHKLVVGEELEGIDFKAVRGLEGIREARVPLGDAGEVSVAVAHGLRSARELCEKIMSGQADYSFIEIMACPGGCIDGGGQPRSKKTYKGNLKQRQQAVYAIDAEKSIRQAHNNPLIERIYADFLTSPNSELAHKLLHTSYSDRKRVIRHSAAEIWRQMDRQKVW
jgi:ferredoxin hydrogenase gamma subunit